MFTAVSCGQVGKKDCEHILKQEIDLDKIENNLEEFKLDIRTMMLCEFDTVDYQIMIGAKDDMVDFSVEMLKYLDEEDRGKIYYFSDLAEEIRKFQKTDEYEVVREIVETRNKLFSKNAELSNWEEDKTKLKLIRFDEEQIEIIKGIVEDNEGKTYEEIFEIAYPILIEREENSEVENTNGNLTGSNPRAYCKNVVEPWKGAITFNSYDDCINCSKKIDRPILFYFFGYGCMECIEFMAKVLTEPDVKNMIDNKYLYIVFETDNIKELNEDERYFSKFQDKEIKTVGERNLDIQLEYFNNSDQPYLVIVSKDGTILREYNEDTDLKKFKDFLDK